MSGLRSRLKDILRPSRPSSPHADTSTPLDVNSNSPRPLSSKPISKTEDFDFLELAPGTDPIVDIVAIHGLQGHREKTWMVDDGTMWLRHFLPTDLCNARVLTYGYDADTHSPECVSTQTMRRHADGFAKALSRKREDPRRPIIFIAHDLGGIILKWALVICHNQGLESKCDLRDILIATHAILFFGTPHFGTDVTLLDAVNRLASVYMETTDAVLRNLRSHSSELEDVQSLYVEASAKISSIFFSGEYMTRGLNVPYHSAVITGDHNATTIVLHADHSNMVRFAARNSNNYQTILHYLKVYVDNALVEAKKKWDIEDNCRSAAKGETASEEVVVPKPRPPVSRGYIERKYIQTLITQNLLPVGPVKHQPRCILHGLGGAGKTQLATNWIQEHESLFTWVIFVDASSRSQLEVDLARSIRCLGPEYSQMKWKDTVAYLDSKDNWLLFLDNADSPDLDLRPYLPTFPRGSILMTTRNKKYISYAPDGAVLVGGLEEGEAVNLLHTTANITPASDTESLEIVRELGMLALAITQAGIYIRETQRLSTYLDTFRKSRNRLLSKQPDIGSEYTSSTYTAFDLSFRQLPTTTQEFLRLCAFLHYSLIPLALFERSTISGFTTRTVLDSFPSPESDKNLISKLQEIFGETWDEVSFQEIVSSASQASFIDVSTDGLFYGIHPLLQTYIKDSLVEADKLHYVRMTTKLILGAIPASEGSNMEVWQLLPHANCIPRAVQSENVAQALGFYSFYNSLGNWEACRNLLECVLPQVQSTQGERHRNSISVMGALGEALLACGQLEKAENMQRDAFNLLLEVSGQRDPDTVEAMNNLAEILRARGQFEEAEKMQREVLALQLEISGQRHPDTLVVKSNLASTLCRLGQLDEAEKIQEDVLTVQLEISGQRHPHTVIAMNNLAETLRANGRFEGAEMIQREVLALRLEISGQRHPDTLAAKSNLASTLYRVGRVDEAEKIQQEVLTVQLEISGQRHPDTIVAMNNLAEILRVSGQFEEAEKMQRKVLALQLEISGKRHPDTLMAMNNLALTLYHRDQLDEAEKMQQELLALRLEVTGKGHPETILAMNNLAQLFYSRGRLDEAERMQREAQTLLREISGWRLPLPLRLVLSHNLSLILYHQEQLEEALQVLEETILMEFEVLGEDHPLTKESKQLLEGITSALDHTS